MSGEDFKASNLQHSSMKKAECISWSLLGHGVRWEDKLAVLFPHSALLLAGPVPAQILPETMHNVPLSSFM